MDDTVVAMNIDTERVITEIRLRPNLWDLSNMFYKDRDARIASWLEVCQAINSNYNQLSTSQQKEYEKAVQQRWKTARDAYTKCKTSLKFLKSGSGGSVKKKYVFYDHMTFLEKPHAATATEDSLPQQIHNSPAPSPLPAPDTPQSNDTEGENDDAQKDIIKRKRKRNLNDDREFEKEMLKILKETSNSAKDDNLTFFMSLSPIVNKFSDYQKLLFRSEVLRVAMEVHKMSPVAESQTEPSMSGSPNRSQMLAQIIEEQQTQDLEIQHSQFIQVQPSTYEEDNNSTNISTIYYQQPSTSGVDNNATNNILYEGKAKDLKNFLIFNKH